MLFTLLNIINKTIQPYLTVLCSNQSIHVFSMGIDGHSSHNLSSCKQREVSWSPFNHNDDRVYIGGQLEGYPGGSITVNLNGVRNLTSKDAKTTFPER